MIEDKKVVAINYNVTDSDGQLIDSSEGAEPLVYLHGSQNIIPGLEAGLTGKAKGEEFNITVEPKDAYGEYRAELVQVVPRDAFEGVESVEPGMAFTAQTQGGPVQLVVTGVEGDDVTVDPNHPLAGKTLTFTGTIEDVREASAEEIEHGHVHGEGGHHH
ncbi:FKBP-type peptidyl-prolyl cis-trans isomerase [Reinekea marinisedimentorum]|uniref:Peptidyl-prolyl cis-trans isomerase n=1 Tax=Reinekea marinisedimentorum TaxID=230495 RepID=A0A4R3IBQ1_9GAMM|nr:peptidylprolyl isomerase [Reinekea marinisedimentorum]TCS43911.1 FKBP-type peptidyl-prolyl cis-trans isomerase SlyD [Reinekea marinisedimentorum]